ncbi:MAG: hypothetical protein ACT6S0_06120 [Roseateles sp.]|uniref:hypothetical protein n=1 Tax=Roseateles sp. TaxID=1971397 RepID=UPI0040358E13
MAFVPPYLVTVTATTGGLAQCSYVDGNGQPVPPDAPLTTTTPADQPGNLVINFVEAKVAGQRLRLVGAAVKTVGHDPSLNPHNYLFATRTQCAKGEWTDSVDIPWAPDSYTTRGVVLLFANVDKNGDMVAFIPSADPQTQNDPE